MELMKDTSHLVALTEGLGREKGRLAQAKTEGERRLREVWVAQAEKEIAKEREFLGMAKEEPCDLSDDELLAAMEDLGF